jgi:hypothetical protein
VSGLRLIAAAMAALLLAPSAALAQGKPVEEKNVLAGKTPLDPASGYIFLHANGRTNGLFLRVPDDATRAEYQKDWEEAFAKAEKKYPGQLKRWENDVLVAKQTKKALPEKPLPPSRETFSIGAIELRDMVSFGPMFVFSKAEDKFSYLTAVKPGTYIYYGPLYYAPGLAPAGMCYCMGTIRFEVKPGMVTDLGNFLIAAPKLAPPYDYSSQIWMKDNEERIAKGKEPSLVPQQLTFGLPDSLKAWPSAQAEFHASGKLNNYFGITITRMPPVPGVLDYKRDAVIDARTGAEVPSPTIYTQVRIKN